MKTESKITKTPKTRPAKTEDGIATGMLVTLHESVAIDMRGNEKVLPPGSLISRPLSGGFDGRVNSNVSRHKLGDEEISFIV